MLGKSSFDANGNLIKENSTLYSYDALNRKVKMVDEQGETELVYDEVGNLISSTRFDQQVQYRYNAYNECIEIQYPNQTKMEYIYNKNGWLMQSNADQLQVEYSYDDLGRVITEQNSANTLITKEYDDNNNLTLQKTEVQGQLVSEYAYQYDSNNNLIEQSKKQLQSTEVLTHEYNENDELIKTIATSNGETVSKEYSYSITGNKVEITDSNASKTMEYNEMDQLIRLTDEDYSYRYIYDANGNRIREARSDGAVKQYKYDAFNQLIEVIDFDQSVIQYTYDGLGNRESQRISREDKDYRAVHQKSTEETFNPLLEQLNRAVLDKEAKQTINTYTLQDYQRRVCEDSDTPKNESSNQSDSSQENTREFMVIHYVNDINQENTQVLASTQGNETQNYYYGHQRLANDDNIYQYDGNLNVAFVMDYQNNVEATYDYSDYGQRSVDYKPWNDGDEYGYRAEAHTLDGLQYLRARYYDTRSETFIQQDSYRGHQGDPLSQNRYDYCLNNPYKYMDPSVHKALSSGILNSVKNAGGKNLNQQSTPSKTTAQKAAQASKNTSSNNKPLAPTPTNNKQYNNQTTQRNDTIVSTGGGSSSKPLNPYTPPPGPSKAEILKQQANTQKTALASGLQSIVKETAFKVNPQVVFNGQTKEKLQDFNKTEITGSLHNKIKGYCSEKGKNVEIKRVDTKEIFEKPFRDIAKFIDDNLHTIAQTAATVATITFTIGVVAASVAIFPVIVVGSTVITGAAIATTVSTMGVLTIAGAGVSLTASVAEVGTSLTGYSLDGRKLSEEEAQQRLGTGLYDGLNSLTLLAGGYFLTSTGNSMGSTSSTTRPGNDKNPNSSSSNSGYDTTGNPSKNNGTGNGSPSSGNTSSNGAPGYNNSGNVADKTINEGASGANGRTFKSSYDIPVDENGYTKSSLSLGQKGHKEYKLNLENGSTLRKEYRLPSGKRIDYIDFETKTIYELKPNNLNQIKLGTQQLQGYLDEVESLFGKGWKTVLDTY